MQPKPVEASQTVDLVALHLLVMALTKSLKVKVVFANVATACTDGQVIYLPHMPSVADVMFVVLVRGYLHHEAGHQRHSDFSLLPIVNAENDPLLMHLYQVLEDVRMEAAHIAEYPGAHRILAELVEVLVALQLFEPPSADDSPAHLAVGLVLKFLRATVLSQRALETQAAHHEALLEASLGRGVVSRLLALGQEIVHAETSADALALARRIRRFLEEEQQKAQAPSDDEQAPPTSGDETSHPTAERPADEPEAGTDGSPTPTRSDASSNKPASEDATGTPTGPDGSSDPTSPGEQVAMPPGADQALSSILSGHGLGEETQDLGQALVGLLQQQSHEQPGTPLVLPEPLPSAHAMPHAGLVTAADRVSARLSSQLKRHLEGESRQSATSMRRGSRVVARHLVRAVFGDPRVFERRVQKPGLNTSVVCLLDASGSMNEVDARARIEVAREAVLATVKALHSLRNVEACAAAFSSGGSVVQILTEFGERPDLVSSRYDVHGSGGTPMAEALLWASRHLATRDADRRKMIFVATDGEPNDVGTTAQVIAGATRVGHEVYGVGIGCADRFGLFPRFCMLGDVGELCNALLTMFQRATVERRA
jgi:cobalamin biosynthesis protein CobT